MSALKTLSIVLLLVALQLGLNFNTCALCADTSNYRLHVQAYAGRSESIIQRTTSVDKAEYSRSGLVWSLRVIAQPDHLLGLGFESGHLHFSTLNVKKDATLPEGSTMSLTAIPILGIFTMEKYGLELSGGVGTFYYRAELDSPGSITTSADWEIGWTAGLAYRFNLAHTWVVAVDSRYYTIPERSVSTLSAGLRVEYQWWY